jgi:hypothetical protein
VEGGEQREQPEHPGGQAVAVKDSRQQGAAASTAEKCYVEHHRASAPWLQSLHGGRLIFSSLAAAF